MSKLNEALQTKNIPGIKSAILSNLSIDPLDRSGEVKRAMTTINQTGIDLCQKHDGTTPLIDETSKWTKDYFAELQAHLLTNFSKEGVEHALKVGRYAYRDELNRSEDPLRPSRPAGNSKHQGGQDNTGKFMMAGVAIVAAGFAIYLILK